jgi:hypothetical protein
VEDAGMTTVGEHLLLDLERLLDTDFAHDRLAAALFEVLADGLDLGPCAVRSPGDRAWVDDAISGPIQRTAEDAIERLVGELTRSFAEVPAALIERMVHGGGDSSVDLDALFIVVPERSPVGLGT